MFYFQSEFKVLFELIHLDIDRYIQMIGWLNKASIVFFMLLNMG